MLQILRSTPATLQVQIYKDGDLTDLDANPTAAAVDGAGNAVTLGAVSKASTGVYQASLAGQSDLKVISVTWTGTLSGDAVTIVQRYEVVGAFLFTEAQLRAELVTEGQAPYADATVYSDDMIRDIRRRIGEQFERRTGRSWFPRYARIEAPGTGGYRLPLGGVGVNVRAAAGWPVAGPGFARDITKILSVTIGGTTVDVSNVVIDGGALVRTDGVWTAPSTSDPLNVVVEYEYGADPVPAEATVAALRMAKATLPGAVSSWATSFSNEDGTFSFAGALAYPPLVHEWLKSQDMTLGIA